MGDSEAEGPDLPEEDVTLAEEIDRAQRKQEILTHLFESKRHDSSWIVTGPEIQAAIEAKKSSLSSSNPANFLKDIVRRKVANDLWPATLAAERITARQRFGQKRVFEFRLFDKDQVEPFPNRFEAELDTPVHEIQSISLPYVARRLGREEETWLAQVVVNLRIVETHLALMSGMSDRLKDIVHLQIGMKTQPEIDATFILTATSATKPELEEHLLLTCEAKRKDERLLEDQLRFQIHQGMKVTAKLKDPQISGVKPIAIKLLADPANGADRLIYIVEFETVERDKYAATWAPRPASKRLGLPYDDAPVYDIPLRAVSKAYYRVRPAVKGVTRK